MKIGLSFVFIFALSTFGCSTTPNKPTIDKEAIRRAIRDNRKSFQVCYDKSLKRNKNSAGKIELTWEIESDGSVKNASVASNTTGDAKFGTCMIEALTKITFIKPPGDTIAHVVFPFIFTADAEMDSVEPATK